MWNATLQDVEYYMMIIFSNHFGKCLQVFIKLNLFLQCKHCIPIHLSKTIWKHTAKQILVHT
jgi:hypothetical protein